MTNLEQIRKKITERITTMDSSEILNLLDVLNGSASDMIMDTRELFSCSICRGKYGVCTVEKHAAFCTLHRDHTVSFVLDADRDMVFGRESKDIIGLLWKPGVPYPGSNQYDMLHL